MRIALVALFYLLLAAPLAAELLTFDSAEEWTLWEKPFGLTQVGAEGQEHETYGQEHEEPGSRQGARREKGLTGPVDENPNG